MRYSMSALIVITLRACARASAMSWGTRAMPPSSSSTSQMTPEAEQPARRARSTAASVWPAHEVHGLGGHLVGGHDEIALVLAVLVVHDDQDPAGADLLHAFLDRHEVARAVPAQPDLAVGEQPPRSHGLVAHVAHRGRGPWSERNRCTYLPTMSISKFTRWPALAPPSVVWASVCGISM